MELRAADVQRLLNDDVFQQALSAVRHEQINIFLNSQYDEETLRDAKFMLEAVKKIEQALQSVLSDEAIKEKRKKLK